MLSKGLIKIILMLPIIGDAVGTLDDRITLCTNLVQCGQTLVRAQQNLRDILVQRGRPADAASLMNHRLPNYEPDLFAMITQKTALDNVLSTLEKGVAAIIFLVLCHRFFRQSEPTADWTYFGILEKVVLAWPEHRFHFPQTLRPLFETLYNVHIACHNVFDITEEDAKNIVESVSLEAIHNLDLRYFG